MSLLQFLILILVDVALLLVMMLVIVGKVLGAVEAGLDVRWKTIKQDFDRLFMVSQGLDTLRETLLQDAEKSGSKVDKAVEVVGLIKDRVDDHEKRLAEIERNPLIRKLGGGSL